MYTNYWNDSEIKADFPGVPDGAEICGTCGDTTYYLQRYDPAHPIYGHWAFWKASPGQPPALTTITEIERLGNVRYWRNLGLVVQPVTWPWRQPDQAVIHRTR